MTNETKIEAKVEKQAAFTPGPWYWNGIASIWNCLGDEEENFKQVYVAEVVTDYGDDSCVEPIPVREANAKLIAASPELFYALSDLVRLCENIGSFCNGVVAPDGTNEGEVIASKLIDNARAALSKAGGQ